MSDLSRRELLKAAGVTGAAALLPSALPTGAQAQTTQKRELLVAQGGDIARFDPHFSTSSNEIRWTFNLFDNLVSRHPDGKLYPGLATEWKLTNPTTWTFKLRSGVKWHNGDPFSAADVKYSFERTWDPKVATRVSTVFTTVDKVEAPDASTVVFTTKKPDPLLPARVAFYGGQIVPKKYLESVGAEQFNAKPIGTGPVRFQSWTKDDKFVLDANPDYFGGKPDFDRLVVRPIPETAARIAALLKGEVDIITQLPPDHGERVNTGNTRVAGALYAGLYVLAVNSKVPPLDNPLVKQALSLAVDRELIVKELWRAVASCPTRRSRRATTTGTPPCPRSPTTRRRRASG
jgi:peptide/nickel transport system substrate-binding protein